MYVIVTELMKNICAVHKTNNEVLKMKKIVILMVLFTCITLTSHADVWMTDYDQALEKGNRENKPILLLFTGSDWCGWCIKLEDQVFSEEEFEEYATEKVVCVKADFPRNKDQDDEVKKQNKKLKKKFGISGFPTVLVLNPKSEEIIANTGYREGGPSKYVDHLKELTSPYHEKHGEPLTAEKLYEQSRVWTNDKGQELKGQLVEYEDDTVMIRSEANGKKYKNTLEALSEKDRKLIQGVFGE